MNQILKKFIIFSILSFLLIFNIEKTNARSGGGRSGGFHSGGFGGGRNFSRGRTGGIQTNRAGFIHNNTHANYNQRRFHDGRNWQGRGKFGGHYSRYYGFNPFWGYGWYYPFWIGLCAWPLLLPPSYNEYITVIQTENGQKTYKASDKLEESYKRSFDNPDELIKNLIQTQFDYDQVQNAIVYQKANSKNNAQSISSLRTIEEIIYKQLSRLQDRANELVESSDMDFYPIVKNQRDAFKIEKGYLAAKIKSLREQLYKAKSSNQDTALIEEDLKKESSEYDEVTGKLKATQKVLSLVL